MDAPRRRAPLPGRVRFYVGILVVATMLLLPLSRLVPGMIDGTPAVAAGALLALLIAGAHRRSVKLGQKLNVNWASAPEVAAAVLLPGPIALLALAGGALAGEAGGGARLLQRAFNVALASLRALVGGLLWTAAVRFAPRSVAEALAGLAVTVAMQTLAVALVIGIAAIQLRESPLRRLRAAGWEMGVTEMALGLTGVMAALAAAHHFWAVTLLLGPIVVAQIAIRGGAALRRSEERFRALVQNASDLIVLVDEAGTVGYVSPSIGRLLGYVPERLVGTNASSLGDIVHPEDRRHISERIAAARPGAGPPPSTELRVRHSDGTWRRMEFAVNNLLHEQTIRGWLLTLIDVTERTRIEAHSRFLADASAALAESLDYETTLGRVTELAVPRLADWCAVDIVTAGAGVQRVGMSHSDPAKTTLLQDLDRRYPRDDSADYGLARVLQTGRSEFYPDVASVAERPEPGTERAEIMARLDNRSYICVPMRARGRTLGAITLVRAGDQRRYDSTDLRLAEDLAARAAQAVDNARLYRDAHEALRLRNQFLAMVSHDLRSPLAAFRASGLLLHEVLGERDDPAAQWLLGKIDATAGRTEAMIQDLVDLAGLQTGRMLDLRYTRADLVAIVRDTVAEQQRTSACHIALHADPPAMVGAWDVVRLQRVAANLFSNAIKYSPEGGVITVTLSGSRADEAGSPAVTLAVRDEGVGIPAADLPRVFDLFHRASNVADQFPGTGTGLASVRQIVEQHGGTVGVESVEGRGTTVTVRLPWDVA